jgi:HlyD family secretion protein
VTTTSTPKHAHRPPAGPPLPPVWARGPLPEVCARVRRFTRTSGPALVALACTLAACTSASTPPGPTTARVERTTVSTAVTSSGALAASTEQNLGFQKGGRLTAVNVKVGDRVTAGQVLATLDDATLRRTLAQQQAELDAQRALLTRYVNSTAVQGAQNSAAQAQAVLSATQDQAKATLDADETTLKRAEKQLDFDEDVRDDAEDRLKADKAACGRSTGSGSATTGQFSRTTVPQSDMMAAMGMGGGTAAARRWGSRQPSGTEPGGSTGTTPGGTTPGATTPTDPATTPGATGTSETGMFSALTAPVDPVGSGACNRVQSDESALASAKRQVETSRTARDDARQQREVDEAAGRVSIENARQSLVSAQNDRAANGADRPSIIAQQQAVVAGAEVAVRQAQADVDDTVLRAPVDGTVSVLNGTVGEYVGASSGTSALAPGGGAVIPGTDSAGAGAVAAAVTRPGGSQFLVLDGADTFRVVVPFEESDAVRIEPNQNVDVSFDAVPDLTRHGTVLAVAPAATATSGVVGYYVTIVLTETDARLRDGQTAQAAVRTEEMRDVPAIPNAAVHRQGAQTTATVLGFDGSRRTVPIQTGVVGDDLTQVVSGLTVGDEVVVGPQ